MQTGDDGALILMAHPSRSSAVLSSVAWAAGLIEIPPGQLIHKGDAVSFSHLPICSERRIAGEPVRRR
ncbi:MAG: hypothetical protein WBG92_19770, partial [Thiohalocapsa sp.]